MWQVALISGILAFIGLLFFGYLRSKTKDQKTLADARGQKVDALEAAAEKARQEERAEDAEEAAGITDAAGALDFLRGSFRR